MTNQYLQGLESRRLILRPLTEDDWESWMEFISSKEALRFHLLRLNSIEDCKTWINKQLERYRKHHYGLLAMINKSDHKMIGNAGLLVQKINGEQVYEIGYHLIPKYWGRGFATEAAITFRDYGFTELYLERIVSLIHVDNERSQKVALRNGMTKARKTTFKGFPVFIFQITRPDWEQAQVNLKYGNKD